MKLGIYIISMLYFIKVFILLNNKNYGHFLELISKWLSKVFIAINFSNSSLVQHKYGVHVCSIPPQQNAIRHNAIKAAED